MEIDNAYTMVIRGWYWTKNAWTMPSQLLQEHFEQDIQDNVTENIFLKLYQPKLWFAFKGVLSFYNAFHFTFECLQESD